MHLCTPIRIVSDRIEKFHFKMQYDSFKNLNTEISCAQVIKNIQKKKNQQYS